MSAWSGLAAAGVAIALALIAFGQPVWEYRTEDSQSVETWSYSPFVAHQTDYNKTTDLTTFRNYSYDQLATLPPGRAQPNRKSTRLNSSHSQISYAVFCLNKK